MIPILYDSTESEFAGNGLARLRDCISCKVSEERNGIYECDFSYPVNGIHYDDIICGRIIAVTHDSMGDVQPFDIISRTNPINGIVEFHAVHISYRQSKLVTKAKNVMALSEAFAAIQTSVPSNPFVYDRDFEAEGYVAACDGLPKTVRSILGGEDGSILNTYGGEYKWDKWKVTLMASRGIDRDLTVRYGVNMTDYSEEIDYSGSYNQVIPFWTDGTRKVIGDVVTAHGMNYSGRDECVPLDLSDRFEKKPIKANLEVLAENIVAYEQPTLPTQNIRVQFVNLSDSNEYEYLKELQRCELCDTVKVIFPLYGMIGRFKVVKVEYDALAERYDSMDLGTVATSLPEALGISNDTSAATLKTDGGETATHTSVNNGSNATVTVQFAADFAAEPNVVGSLYDVRSDANTTTNTHQLVVQLKSVTATEAVFNVRNNGSQPRLFKLQWVAVGN